MEASRSLAALATPRDLYYTDADNALKASIKVEYDTRFTQAFQTLNGGQQVITIPPGNGLKHAVIVMGFNAAALAALAALDPVNARYALQAGFGYEMIDTVSWRVGGSANYYLSGSQLLARNLRQCRTKEQRQQLFNLGGSQAVTAADYGSDKLCYIPLSFWSSPSTDSLETPLASDVLGQQIQITITLKPIASIFHLAAAGVASPASLPAALSLGYVQVEQLSMVDRSMSLANSVDLNTATYVQAIRSFDQQELVGTLAASAAEQAITFSGIMAGQCRGLQVYLTPKNPVGDAAANTNVWALPKSVVAVYAGTQYAVYRDSSSQIWNMLDGTAPAFVDSSSLSSAAAVWSAAPAMTNWVHLPFSQPIGSDYEANVLVEGKQLTNGAVTLQIVSPNPAIEYDVHVIPVMVGAIAFSRGSANVLIG